MTTQTKYLIAGGALLALVLSRSKRAALPSVPSRVNAAPAVPPPGGDIGTGAGSVGTPAAGAASNVLGNIQSGLGAAFSAANQAQSAYSQLSGAFGGSGSDDLGNGLSPTTGGTDPSVDAGSGGFDDTSSIDAGSEDFSV